jgi:hypothetical protein
LTYLDNTNAVHNSLNGFAYNHLNHPEFIDQEPNPAWSYAHRGAVGGAWAFRRTAFEKMQQTLLDRCILGSADWHMAFALAMRQDVHPEMKFAEIPGYVRMIQNWKERASALRGNIGYCDTHAVHHWHGTLKNRGYGSRWQILTRNGFDPYRDITYDFQGLIELSNNQTKMAHQIRAYFASRNEDGLISD